MITEFDIAFQQQIAFSAAYFARAEYNEGGDNEIVLFWQYTSAKESKEARKLLGIEE